MGVSPTIELPVGTHEISLIVFDGSETSTPDTVTITVQEETGGEITVTTYPSTVNRNDSSAYLLMFVTLPNTLATDINENFGLLLYPGGVQSDQVHITQQTDGSSLVFAMFDEEEILTAIPSDGSQTFTVFGQYTDSSLYNTNVTLTLIH